MRENLSRVHLSELCPGQRGSDAEKVKGSGLFAMKNNKLRDIDQAESVNSWGEYLTY